MYAPSTGQPLGMILGSAHSVCAHCSCACLPMISVGHAQHFLSTIQFCELFNHFRVSYFCCTKTPVSARLALTCIAFQLSWMIVFETVSEEDWVQRHVAVGAQAARAHQASIRLGCGYHGRVSAAARPAGQVQNQCGVQPRNPSRTQVCRGEH